MDDDEDEAGPSCKFFTGLMHKTCKAGVTYEKVRVAHASTRGLLASIPCMADMNVIGVTCDRYEELTPAERAANRAEVEHALALIEGGTSPCCLTPLRRGKRGRRTTMTCPKCEQVVSEWTDHEEQEP
jgi:hypothetical protein